MRNLKMVAIVSAGLMAAQAHAQEVPAGRTGSGSLVFADLSRVTTGREGSVRIWTRWDHSQNRGERARSSRILYSFNCSEQSYQVISSVDYRPNGTVLDSDSNIESRFLHQPVTPGSVGEAIFEVACRR